MVLAMDIIAEAINVLFININKQKDYVAGTTMS